MSDATAVNTSISHNSPTAPGTVPGAEGIMADLIDGLGADAVIAQNPELPNVDVPDNPIVAPNNRIVVGASTSGNVLVNSVDVLLERVLTEAIGRIPGVGATSNRTREEVVEDVLRQVKQRPNYKGLRDKLLDSAQKFDTFAEEVSDTLLDGHATPIGAGNSVNAFQFADLIGFEVWVPPFNSEALAHFGDGKGNPVTDVVDYLSTSLSKGFANIKVFTDPLKRLPGVDGKAVEVVTNLLNAGVQAFGAGQADLDVGEIIGNFALGGGTILSDSDLPSGNNFQVGIPFSAFDPIGSINEGFAFPSDEIWLTSLTYNVPIGGENPDNPIYLGYSDLRRTVLTRDDNGDWDFSQFIVADRAFELGVRLLPGNENTGNINLHVGSIGRFSRSISRDSVINGNVRQLEDGTIGFFFEENGRKNFRPFDDQDHALFANVFLAGQQDLGIDDIQVLRATDDFTVLTDETLAADDNLGPVAKWVVENAARPEIQDLWSAGVTLVPALLTGDPVSVVFAGVNAFIDVNHNQFERVYDATVDQYSIGNDEGGEHFVAQNFVTGEFFGIAADLEHVENLHAQYNEITGFDITLEDFISNETSLPLFESDGTFINPELQDIVSQRNGIVEYIEHRVEALQGVSTRLITEGHTTGFELYDALLPFLDSTTEGHLASPEGMDGLFSSLAHRLLGGREPIRLFSGEGREASTDWSEDIAANIAHITLDTSRPEILEILHDTDRLTNLEEFSVARLGDIEDATSAAEVATILIERESIDPFQVYDAVHDGNNAAFIDTVAELSPGFEVAHLVNTSLERSLNAVHGPDSQGQPTEAFSQRSYSDKIQYLNSLTGGNLTASIEDFPQVLDVYRQVLTGEITLPPESHVLPIVDTFPGSIGSVVEGSAAYNILIEDLALSLIENGFVPATTGNDDLDSELLRFAVIRDSGIPVEQLTDAYPITEEAASRIDTAREVGTTGSINHFQLDYDLLSLLNNGGEPTANADQYAEDFADAVAGINVQAGLFATSEGGALVIGGDTEIPRSELPSAGDAVLAELIERELIAFSALQQSAPNSADYVQRLSAAEENIVSFIESIPTLSSEQKDAIYAEVFVSPENGLRVLAPQSGLDGPLADYANLRDELAEAGTFTEDEIDQISYFQFRLNAANNNSEGTFGYSNDIVRDTAWDNLSAADQGALGRPAFDAIFQTVYGETAQNVIDAQLGDENALERLGDLGIDPFSDTTFLDIGRSAIERATDPTINAEISALLETLPEGAPATAIALAVSQALASSDTGANGTPPPASLSIAEIRADIGSQLELLRGLPGAEAQTSFLSVADQIFETFDLVGGDFSLGSVGEYLSTAVSNGSFDVLLGALSVGDEAAWSALLADAGAFASTLGAEELSTIQSAGTGLSTTGSFLNLLGVRQGDEALRVSGEFLSVAGNTLQAIADNPGDAGAQAAITLGSGFAQIGAGFAARTETVVDDIAAVATDHGFRAWDFFRQTPSALNLGNIPDFDADALELGTYSSLVLAPPSVDTIQNLGFDIDSDLGILEDGEGLFPGTDIGDTGQFNNNLLGWSVVARGAGQILNLAIDGKVGDILQALGDTAGVGLSLAAGAMTPQAAALEISNIALDAIGIELPPEASYAAQLAITAAYASNPIGWAAFAFQTVLQFASIRNWTEFTTLQDGIDADADFSADDTALVGTDFSSNFFGRVSVEGGALYYDVNSVNPELIETITFSGLTDQPIAKLNVHHDDGISGQGDQYSVEINGETYSGRLTSNGRDVNSRGFTGSGRNSVRAPSAQFVADDNRLAPLPVAIQRDRESVSFELTQEALDLLPRNYRVDIGGTFGALNPETNGETFSQTLSISAEEFNELQGDFAGANALTIAGGDPRLLPVDNLATPENEGAPTAISSITGRIDWRFDGNRGVSNIYQYQDVNSDGNLDLLRYGHRADGDGLNSGDEFHEITLRGANDQPLSVTGPDGTVHHLPTVRDQDLQTAADIGSLAPYLYQWVAANPDLGFAGLDPNSLYQMASEHGVLDTMVRIRDLNAELSLSLADIGSQLETLEAGDGTAVSAAALDVTSPFSAEQIAELDTLRAEIGFFDTEAYAAANEGGIPENILGNNLLLSWHYIKVGNPAGLATDATGTILPVADGPVWDPSFAAALHPDWDEGELHGGRVNFIGHVLDPGVRMTKNEMLLSQNKEFATIFWENGNLVTYDLRGAVPRETWRAERSGNTDDGWVEMQRDGNFVIYDNDGDAEFSSETYRMASELTGEEDFSLVLGDGGNLIVHDFSSGSNLWIGGEGAFANGGRGIRPGVAVS